MGVLLFLLLVILVLAVLLGAGGYSVRRYWSPAGSEVVEMGGNVAGAGGVAATINNPSVASPLPLAGVASPSAQASVSPSASPSASPSK